MRLILSIIFVFTSLLSYSQQDPVFITYNQGEGYKTDTLLYIDKDAVLYGTRVLPGTENQMNAIWLTNLLLTDVTIIPCKSGDEYLPLTEVTTITETKNNLDITIQFTANCGHSFLCDVQIIDEKTINLIYTGYGEYALSKCCFELTYHFEKLKNDSSDKKPGYTKLVDIVVNGEEFTRKKLR